MFQDLNSVYPKKNILLLTHCYPSGKDCIRGRFFLPYVRRLQEFANVDIITPSWQGEGVKPISFHGENVITFPWKGRRFANLKLLNPCSLWEFFKNMLRWRRTISQYQKEYKPGWDLVIIMWGFPNGLLLSTSLKSIKKVIWWLGTDVHLFLKPRFFIFWQLVSRSAHYHWASGQHLVQVLQKKLNRVVSFCPLLELDDPLLKQIFTKRESSIPYIISIGRLEQIKRFDIAIRAIQKVLAQGFPVKYDIFGDGVLHEKLAALISEKDNLITLRGHISRELVCLALIQADILLISSDAEGLPIVFFEALLTETLVVSTAVGDLPNLATANKHTVLLSTEGDIDALAANLISAIKGEVFFDSIYARDCLQSYSVDTTVEETKRLLDFTVNLILN